MSYLIQANNIIFRRQRRNILHNVSLEISAGEFVTIIGPNGAGKSTLLKILLGIEQPSEGNIIRQSDLRIGYMPQNIPVTATLPITVKDFLLLNKTVVNAEIEHVLTEVGAIKSSKQKLHLLSGGELQRVLLARALLDNPQLLVLDEPAQNLDVHGELVLYELIDKIYKQRKCSVLLVSHDLHMVMKTSQRVICLYHHVCCSGKPEHISKEPGFIEIFGDEYTSLMKYYQHDHDHDHKA